MKAEQLTKSAAKVSLSHSEVYILLQCVDEARQRLSDNDVETIMRSTKNNLKELTDQLLSIMEKMESGKAL